MLVRSCSTNPVSSDYILNLWAFYELAQYSFTGNHVRSSAQVMPSYVKPDFANACNWRSEERMLDSQSLISALTFSWLIKQSSGDLFAMLQIF